MDPLKLRPLGVMILALLHEADMHPYEMMRLLRARHDDRLVKVQNGTFYHQVGALERDGFIAELGVDRDGNRPERTTYTLLPAGRAATNAWVRDRIAHADKIVDFRVALAEAHNLGREEFATLLTHRVESQHAEHASLRAGVDAAYQRDVDPQFLIEVERHLALLLADIAWAERMLAQLADPDYAWACPSERHRAAKRERHTPHIPDHQSEPQKGPGA